jgi:hypothetical protein
MLLDPFLSHTIKLSGLSLLGESMAKGTEKRLEKTITQEAMETDKEMAKICDECIKSLESMHINVKKDISTDQMMKILRDGTKQLGKLQKKWAGMTEYFQSIKSYIEKVMNKRQNMFVENDQNSQEHHAFLIAMLTNSIQILLESSIKSHRTFTI